MHNDLTDVSQPGDAATPHGAARRRLIGAGLGGAVVSLLPVLTSRASATTPPGNSTPVPPTTAPPKRPTDDDVRLLVFAQSVELAARELYDIGLTADLSELEHTMLITIREAHEAYAQAISGLLGRLADGVTNTDLVDTMRDSFSGSVGEVLQAAYDLESTIVATHADLLGEIQGTDGARLIASVLVSEARHGTVLADLRGDATLDELLVTDKADALSPAEG